MAILTVLRCVAAVFVGLVVLSFIAESVEVALVSYMHGAMPAPEDYFDVRNQPAILWAKFVYNTVAAVIAGFATAWIAFRHEMKASLALAALQTALFVWGMTASEFAGSLAAWVWIPVSALMAAGIVMGAWLNRKWRKA